MVIRVRSFELRRLGSILVKLWVGGDKHSSYFSLRLIHYYRPSDEVCCDSII